MKPLPPPPGGEQTPLDAEDLIRLGYLLSGRLQLECPRCQSTLKPTVESRELRIGSSPDLSALNPEYVSRPRLVFYCTRCQRTLGFVQGDHWNHVERGESKTNRIKVGEFDLED